MTSIPTFDAAANGHNVGTGNLTVAHTCTGSNLMLIVFVKIDTWVSITSVKYNNVTMTLKRTVVHASHYDLASYYLAWPSTWLNNIVVTVTGSHSMGLVSASYTWVAQTSSLDLDSGTTANSGNTLTETSAATVSTNEKIVGALGYDGYSASSPSFAPTSSWTNRVEDSFSNNNGTKLFDINAATITTYSVGGTLSWWGSWAMQLNYLSLKPVADASRRSLSLLWVS